MTMILAWKSGSIANTYRKTLQILAWVVAVSAIVLVLAVPVGADETRTETEDLPSLHLIAAVENGDTETVRELLADGKYLPGSLNGLRAYRASQQGRTKHAEIAKLMQSAFDEWWESGAFYDSLMSSLTKIRESALETGTYNRPLTETTIKDLWKGFFEGLDGELKELYGPIMARYEPAEFDQTLMAELDALDDELVVKLQPFTGEMVVIEDYVDFSNDQVREAQELLTELGYKPGPADGLWGLRTGEAYQSFLSDKGLPIIDVLTAQTLQELRNTVSSDHSDDNPVKENLMTLDGVTSVKEQIAEVSVSQCDMKNDKNCWKTVDNHAECFVFNELFSPVEIFEWTGNCVDGFVHGSGNEEWKIPDDQIIATGTGVYSHGKKHGYWEMGELFNEYEGVYVDGKKHGLWEIRSKLGFVSKGPYVHGKKHGHWVYRYANGAVSKGLYVDGKIHGRWVEQLTNGDVYEGPYVDQKRHGHWVLRSSSGEVSEGTFVEGEAQGRWVVRNSSGDVGEGSYVNGKRHGLWVVRDSNGNESKFNYVNGVLQ